MAEKNQMAEKNKIIPGQSVREESFGVPSLATRNVTGGRNIGVGYMANEEIPGQGATFSVNEKTGDPVDHQKKGK
jgi:hypothetical protein